MFYTTGLWRVLPRQVQLFSSLFNQFLVFSTKRIKRRMPCGTPRQDMTVNFAFLQYHKKGQNRFFQKPSGAKYKWVEVKHFLLMFRIILAGLSFLLVKSFSRCFREVFFFFPLKLVNVCWHIIGH